VLEPDQLRSAQYRGGSRHNLSGAAARDIGVRALELLRFLGRTYHTLARDVTMFVVLLDSELAVAAFAVASTGCLAEDLLHVPDFLVAVVHVELSVLGIFRN
jgi:hypothetical protein